MNNTKQHNKDMETLAQLFKLDDQVEALTDMLNEFIKFSVSEALSEGGEMELCRKKMLLNRKASKLIKNGKQI